MNFSWRWLCVLSATCVVAVVADNSASIIGHSCVAAIKDFDYGCESKQNYTCACRNPVFLATVVYCIRNHTYTYIDEIVAQWVLNDTCVDEGNKVYELKDFDVFYHNATKYISKTSASPAPSPQSTHRQTVPFSVNNSYVQSYIAAAQLLDNNKATSRYLASALYAYLGLMLIIGALSNIMHNYGLKILCSKLCDSLWIRKIRSYMLVPPRIRSIDLPSLSGFAAIGYQLIHFILLFVDYHITRSPILPSPSLQIAKHLADRTGVLAAAQLPLVMLFAQRNLLLTKITGWAPRSFMHIHYWIASGLAVDIFIHGVVYAVLSQRFENFREDWVYSYLRWGCASAICAIAMVFQGSIRQFSLRFSKLTQLNWARSFARSPSVFFTLIHASLVLVFIIGAYYHMRNLGEIPYLWVAIGLWAADWVIRIIHIVPGLPFTRSMIIYHQTSLPGVIEIKVDRNITSRLHGGSHVWLYILKWNRAWHATPFFVIQTPTGFRVLAYARPTITEPGLNYLKRHPHSCMPVKIMTEGFYNFNRPLKKYDTVVFIAGGLCFASLYHYALDIGEEEGEGRCQTKVVFNWIMDTSEQYDLFSHEVKTLENIPCCKVSLYAALNVMSSSVDSNEDDRSTDKMSQSDTKHDEPLATTLAKGLPRSLPTAVLAESNGSDRNSAETVTPEWNADEDPFGASAYTKYSDPFIDPIFGGSEEEQSRRIQRPNIKWIVFQNFASRSGPVAFVVSGSQQLSVDVKTAVNQNIENSSSRIDFYQI